MRKIRQSCRHSSISDHLSSCFSTSPTNDPRLPSLQKAGTHSPSPIGSHTSAYTAKQGAFRTGALSLPSDRFARFGNPARPGVRTANFAAFWPWPGALSKNAEGLRDSDALMHVAVPRRRGPAGLRNPFSFLSKLRLVCPALRGFPCVRGEGWYHYPQRALRAAETPDGRLSKRLICRFLRSDSPH